VVCPPTCYSFVNGEYFTYKYLVGTINSFPQYLYDFLEIIKNKK